MFQAALYYRHDRVQAAEDAPRSRCQIFELGHGLAEIVERGAVVSEER